MYEFFEHTADLGLRIQAPDINTLFAEAAEALFAAIVEDLSTVLPDRQITINLGPDEVEYLLFDWLKELLYYFDTEHLLFGKFEVRVTELGLQGQAWGESIDRSKHNLEHEVKAITYHGFKIEENDNGWLAEVIVDI